MNSYFGLSSTNNPPNVQQAYPTDYQQYGNFRLTTKDSGLINPYTNLNMMPTGSSSHLEQYHPSTNEYFLSTSSGTPSTFPNPMLYYAHPWMRPGTTKFIRRRMIYRPLREYLTEMEQIKMIHISIIILFALELHLEHKRSRQTYTRHQTLELEKVFLYSK